MYPDFVASTQSTFDVVVAQTVMAFNSFLPRIVGALLVLIIGAAIAKTLRRLVTKILEKMKVSKLVEKTPIEHFLINADLTKLEVVIGGVVYWLVMLIVLHTTVSILGLEPLSQVLNTLLSYIPNVVSAILVLFFGVLLAGLVESLVKGAIRSIDGKAARLFGKITSYLVMSIAVLAAVSELGIARDFITILFVGFVATISVGLGLALGLGGQHVVRAMLEDWYQRVKKEVKETKEVKGK